MEKIPMIPATDDKLLQLSINPVDGTITPKVLCVTNLNFQSSFKSCIISGNIQILLMFD